MNIVHDAVANMHGDFLAGWFVVALLVDRSGVGGVCHGPRRIISTKKVAVIVQNYHREPCYFDDDEIVWLDNVISPLIV